MLKNLLARPRLVMAAFGLFCVSAVSIAALLGKIMGLEACAMCWFQRLAFLLAGAGFLISAAWPMLRLVSLRLAEFGLLLGLASAARQVYLVAHPEMADGSCAAGLFYYLQIEDYKGFLNAGLVGGIDCAENQPLILGLSLPQWSLLAFCLTILAYLAWRVYLVKTKACKC